MFGFKMLDLGFSLAVYFYYFLAEIVTFTAKLLVWMLNDDIELPIFYFVDDEVDCLQRISFVVIKSGFNYLLYSLFSSKLCQTIIELNLHFTNFCLE